MILMDEMSIQPDIQMIKKGSDWHLIGPVDLGPLVNDLESIKKSKDGIQLATHYFQYIYVAFNGFRWPVAHYATNNVNGHSIYLTFWPLVDALSTYGFEVHSVLMDGSNNNRQFTHLHVKAENARIHKYLATDPFDATHHVSLIQDCKHVIKKIRNSLLSSRSDPKSKRQLLLQGKYILWEQIEKAFEFNCKSHLRLYRRLTRDHIYVDAPGKMRNHLAINVLNWDMLNLMKTYQSSLEDPSQLDGMVLLLEHTAPYIDIFSNCNSMIYSVQDHRIQKLLDVLHFFQRWEGEYSNPKDINKHLISSQTRQDIDSSIYGFIEMVNVATKLHIGLIPGYFNSDLIENWFCQMRGLRNGSNQNPSLSQIGPGINSNLITGSLISKKGNSGGNGRKYPGVMPPCKKKKLLNKLSIPISVYCSSAILPMGHRRISRPLVLEDYVLMSDGHVTFIVITLNIL